MRSLDIIAVSGRAALGLNALQVAMCMRAGLFEPQTSPLLDKRDQRVGLCLAGAYSASGGIEARLRQLAVPALAELAAQADISGWPLLAALAEPERPGMAEAAGWARTWANAAGIAVDGPRSATLQHGHAAVAYALERAWKLLDAGAPGVIVLAVDSYVEPEAIRWLDDGYRLHALGALDGMVPGEAAAALALRATPERPDGAALAHLLHVATGRELGGEARPEQSDEHEQAEHAHAPNIAATMTALVQQAQAAPISWVLNDVNGERHRLREWQQVAFRHNLFDEHERRLPERLGDVGAASGAMMAVAAVEQWRAGCAPAPRALALLHAEAQERGVMVLAEAPRQQPAGAFVGSAGVSKLHPQRTAAVLPQREFTEATDSDEPDLPPVFDVAKLFREARAMLDKEKESGPDTAQPGPDTAQPGQPAPDTAQPERAEPADEQSGALLQLRPSRNVQLRAQGERRLLQRLVRSCIEEIGVAGNLRKLDENERWGPAVQDAERRLLVHIDALVALGETRGDTPRVDVPAEVLRLAADALAEDPFRAFACTLALGCLDGDDAAEVMLELLRSSPPATYEAQAHALALVPHPLLDPLLRQCCGEQEHTELVATALKVLAARRAAEVPEATLLLQHVDGSVRAAAARCIAATAQPHAMLPLLLAAWRVETEDEVLSALALALLRSDRRLAAQQLRAHLSANQRAGLPALPLRIELLRLLALLGAPEDVPLLQQAIQIHPEAAEAAGWHGAPQLIEPLLTQLSQTQQPTEAQRLCLALRRLTGAPLDVAAERPDRYDGVVEPAPWQDWWQQHRGHFVSGRRYRWGERHSRAAVVNELGLDEVPFAVRRTLALELSLEPGMPWINVSHWAAAQRAQLAPFTG